MKKSKKILSVTLSAIMLLSGAPAMSASSLTQALKLPSFSVAAHAEDVTVVEEGSCGYETKYVLTSDGTLTISANDDNLIGGSIYNDAFSARRDIKHVIIENRISFIYPNAFVNCKNLESVKFGDNVSYIESYAFYRCEKLTNIEIPAGVIEIGVGAFADCTGLTEVILHDGLKKIEDYAFHNCCNLTEITIPYTVQTIGGAAFMECSALTDVIISDGVTDIGNQAFELCENLSHIEIPDSVTYIGDNILTRTKYFYNPENWENGQLYVGKHLLKLNEDFSGELVVKEGTKTVSPYLNNYREDYYSGKIINITSVSLPEGLVYIGEYAINNCPEITDITLPESLTEIGSAAFKGCSGLASLYIPKNVENIDGNIVWDCGGLTSICVDEENRYYDSRENCNAIIETNRNILLSACCNTFIPEGVSNIAIFAYYGVQAIKDLYIPKTVTFISEQAFDHCAVDETIVVDEENTRYDSRENCNAIIDSSRNRLIKACDNSFIPASVAELGEVPFYNCTKLEHITIPGNVKTVPVSSFYGCTSLKEIELLDGVERIYFYELYPCSSLERIILPKTLKEFSTLDLRKNSYPNLREVIIDEENPYYGTKNTYGIREVYSKTTGSTILRLTDADVCGENARYTLENGVLTISPIDPSAEYASVFERFFYGDEIKKIIIEEGITEIEESAFSYCNNVESISLPDTLVRIEDGNFDSMYRLRSLHIPANLAYISMSRTSFPLLEKITVDPKNHFYDSRENSNALFETETNTLIKGCNDTVVPDSTEHIGDNAFSYCTELESVTCPQGLKSIGTEAFLFCNSLESVNLPSTLTSLGEYTFSGCVSLKNINLPENLETIPECAFSICLNLKELVIPEGTKEIGAGAFMLSGLEEISLPQSLEEISYDAFNFTNIKKYIVKSKTLDLSKTRAALTAFYPEKTEDAMELIYNYLTFSYNQSAEILTKSLCDELPPEFQDEIERFENEFYSFLAPGEETDNYIYSANPGALIIGYQGSSAQAYAEENCIDFTSCPLGEHTNIQYNTEGLDATCTEKGFIGGSACLDCETVLEMPEIIPAKGHKVVTVAAIPATCIMTGLTEGQNCSVCGKVIVPQVEIPTIEHIDTDGDNICDNCHNPVDSEEEIRITFVEQLKRVFSNIINSILSLFKKLFG